MIFYRSNWLNVQLGTKKKLAGALIKVFEQKKVLIFFQESDASRSVHPQRRRSERVAHQGLMSIQSNLE